VRYACLRVPDLAVALARRDEPRLWDHPVLVAAAGSVRGCSPEARRDGVTVGMPLRQALARCPRAAALAYREQDVVTVHAGIRAAAAPYAVAIEDVEHGHLHADVSGMPAFYGLDPRVWALDLYEALVACYGLPVRAGLGGLLFEAHVATAGILHDPAGADLIAPVSERRGGMMVVPGRSRRAYLAGLPVDVLPVEAAVIEHLHLFGLHQLGQLIPMPLGALQAQFGPAGALIWRLARGKDDLPFRPLPETVSVSERLDLPSPTVAIEPLIHGTRMLLERALQRPEVQGRSVRQVRWQLGLENGEHIERRVTFRESTAGCERMVAAIRAKAGRIELAAPALSLAVEVSGICGETGRQVRLWDEGPRFREALREAVTHVEARLGGPQVFQIVTVEPWSRIPERQVALIPYTVLS
jgi:nucleotidyltransferase/DNA polymerase involved in DNA repair